MNKNIKIILHGVMGACFAFIGPKIIFDYFKNVYGLQISEDGKILLLFTFSCFSVMIYFVFIAPVFNFILNKNNKTKHS